MLKQLLFKRTALGIYVFEISLSKTVNNSVIRTSYGLMDGKKTTYNDIGDSKKYESIINDKKRKGYVSNTDLGIPIIIEDTGGSYTNLRDIDSKLPKYNTDLDNYSKPMKCQKFVVNKFTYPCLGQPKINGVRATIRWAYKDNGLFSDWGVMIKSHEGIIYNIKRIEKVFEKIYSDPKNKDIVFDGEVYHIGSPVTTISGAARNVSNVIHKYLQFHCFDLAIEDVPQKDRIRVRYELLKQSNFSAGELYEQTSLKEHSKTNTLFTNAAVIDVLTIAIESDDYASEFRQQCIDAGYEGCVIRNTEATYKFGSRPVTMMKLKKCMYISCKVIDIVPFGFDNTDNDIGKGCKFILQNDITEDTFECNPTGTVQTKLDYVNNKSNFIGTFVKVRCFERTINKLPFHANVIIE